MYQNFRAMIDSPPVLLSRPPLRANYHVSGNHKTLLDRADRIFDAPKPGPVCTKKISFNRDIRPILSRNCFHCHGPDSTHREADLRLDIEDGIKSTASDEAIIHPGKPNQSLLFERIISNEPDLVMPPADSGKSLKPAEMELIKQWIAERRPLGQNTGPI